MEKNLVLLEGKAERNLLVLCEEVEKLQKNAHEKKHKLQHLKKETELSEALERQVCLVLQNICGIDWKHQN